MKSQASRKLIHFLLTRDNQQGWTYGDTLGLVLIVSIVPFLCGNPFTYFKLINQNRQLEAKNNITNITRTQQAYFLEHNHFAKSIQEANIKINPETENYQYSTTSNNITVYSYVISKKKQLKSYISGVFILPKTNDSVIQTIGIICENKTSGTMKPTKPILQNNLPICGQGTSEIGKYL